MLHTFQMENLELNESATNAGVPTGSQTEARPLGAIAQPPQVEHSSPYTGRPATVRRINKWYCPKHDVEYLPKMFAQCPQCTCVTHDFKPLEGDGVRMKRCGKCGREMKLT